jgi:hypothetical protein
LIFIKQLFSNKNTEVHWTFLARKTEGFFSIPIENHLWKNEKKFRKLFSLNWNQFIYVLNLIEKNITTKPKIKIPKIITTTEKLAVK